MLVVRSIAGLEMSLISQDTPWDCSLSKEALQLLVRMGVEHRREMDFWVVQGLAAVQNTR